MTDAERVLLRALLRQTQAADGFAEVARELLKNPWPRQDAPTRMAEAEHAYAESKRLLEALSRGEIPPL